MYLPPQKYLIVYCKLLMLICDDLPFSFRQILFALQFLLQQLKHTEAGIVKLAIDVMVKVLSLGKVGRINCVLLGFVIVLFFVIVLLMLSTQPESTIAHRN